MVEVGRQWCVAGAADFEEAHDSRVEVEGQAVGVVGDHLADVGADEGPAVAGEASGEVVVAVLGGEVADEDLPRVSGGRAGGAGGRDASGNARPGQAVGPV
ncbi:hypothetical protein AB0D46_15580 [Streptomyces sp. NPDC048383]|uniref:hypothetical protein n=1 Tax=Streptomyces sp. NPDC048383 TaxID=3155386 RepID=UPI00343E99D7